MNQNPNQFSSQNRGYTRKGQVALLKIVGISVVLFYLLPLIAVTIADGMSGLEGMLEDVYLKNPIFLFGSLGVLAGACLLWGVRVGKSIKSSEKDSFLEAYKSMAGVMVTFGVACIWVYQLSVGKWGDLGGMAVVHLIVLIVGAVFAIPLCVLLTGVIKRERKKLLDGQEF